MKLLILLLVPILFVSSFWWACGLRNRILYTIFLLIKCYLDTQFGKTFLIISNFFGVLKKLIILGTLLPWNIISEFVKKKTAVTPFLWLTFIEFSPKMKCRSHKIDNCYKLSLRESVTHPFRPSLAPPLFVREKSLNITLATFTLKRFLDQLFLLIWSVLKLFDLPVWSLLFAAWLLPCFIVQSKHQIRSTFCKKIRKKLVVHVSCFWIITCWKSRHRVVFDM